jgi:hypothetical protein
MSIPEDFIKRTVDTLLTTGDMLPSGPMKDAVLLRAGHLMDLVESWREYQRNTPPQTTVNSAP